MAARRGVHNARKAADEAALKPPAQQTIQDIIDQTRDALAAFETIAGDQGASATSIKPIADRLRV